MLDEREYMSQWDGRYDPRPDETTLAPLIIKIGANPIPDPSTPEGRRDINVDTVIFTIVILAIIIGQIVYPS